MPMGGNPYACPAAMGSPRRASGPVNTGISRASGHINFFNALVIGGAKSAIISCIVFPAGGILLIIIVTLIGAFADQAMGMESFTSPRGLINAGRGIGTVIILYLLAYVCLTTLFYARTMNSICRHVR